MKNLKRIVLLIALAVIAGKVLFSDFDFLKSEDTATVSINNK